MQNRLEKRPGIREMGRLLKEVKMALLGNFAAGRKPDQLSLTASIFGKKAFQLYLKFEEGSIQYY